MIFNVPSKSDIFYMVGSAQSSLISFYGFMKTEMLRVPYPKKNQKQMARGHSRG